MADIVGTTEAFLNEARAAFERMQRIPGLIVVKGEIRFSVSHPLGNRTLIEGSLNELPPSKRRTIQVVMNGSIWQYEVVGLDRDAGMAICIAVARRFGDLEKPAALTLIEGLKKKFQTLEVTQELFLV